MKMCLEVLKVERKKLNGNACLCTWSVSSKSFYGLVGVCLHYNFSCSDNHFFWQFSVGQIHFGWCILAPCGAHKCFELQYLKKKEEKTLLSVKRTSTAVAKVVILLVKLPFLFPLLRARAIRCPQYETGSGKKKGSRIGNDRAKLHDLALDPIHSWSTAADSCPPSHFSDRPPISISMTTGRKWLTWNRSIDRFQVSHFRPVVMEIEIGGPSEKSLGGQESAAVDQECMGSNASLRSFGLSLLIRLSFFARTGFLSGAATSSQ